MTPGAASPSLLAVAPAARALAAAHPDCALPCPGCASTVNAQNLAGHLAKVHGVELDQGASAATTPFTLTGPDGRTWIVAVATSALWLAGLVAFVMLRSPAPPLELLLVFMSAVPVVVLVAREAQGKLRTQLRVDGQRLVLRGVLGLGERVVTLPARLESGRRVASRPAPPGLPYPEHQTVDQDVGCYLRVVSGRASLTITAEKAPGLARHWLEEGWARGPRARAHDLRVSSAELVQLTIHLASLGLLKPKPGER